VNEAGAEIMASQEAAAAADELPRRLQRLAAASFLATALLVVVALVIQMAVTANQTGGHFASGPARVANIYAFFTIQSNIIVAVTCLLLVTGRRLDSVAFAAFRLVGLVDITITRVVYQTVLAGQKLTPWGTVADVLLHAVVPGLAIAAWLLFGPRGLASWRVSAYAFLVPLAWVIFTLIRGAAIHWYPYPFIDVDRQGYARVALNVAVITLIYWLLCWAVIALDRRLRRMWWARMTRRATG
jgi:hypothetical protein